MAYNKDNYENNRLTPKQERFVEEIAKGKSQRQAYLTAYPNSKNYQENTVDSRASVLMKNKKVIKRLDELRKIEENRIEWTRKRALNEINYVLDMNKQDMIRINEAVDNEIAMKEAELKEWVNLLTVPNIDMQAVQKKIKNLMAEINSIKQRRRVNAVNTNGILNAAKVLNRMYGLDITKVEISEKDEEREEMEKLSVEELKAIAYANINRNTDDKD